MAWNENIKFNFKTPKFIYWKKFIRSHLLNFSFKCVEPWFRHQTAVLTFISDVEIVVPNFVTWPVQPFEFGRMSIFPDIHIRQPGSLRLEFNSCLCLHSMFRIYLNRYQRIVLNFLISLSVAYISLFIGVLSYAKKLVCLTSKTNFNIS